MHTFTAADAVADTIAALDCTRIALVVPYPDWLSRTAVGYWEARSLTVTGVVKPRDVVSIYDITPEAVIESVARLDLRSTEPILLSGTGIATRQVLEDYAPRSEIPVVSAQPVRGLAGTAPLPGTESRARAARPTGRPGLKHVMRRISSPRIRTAPVRSGR